MMPMTRRSAVPVALSVVIALLIATAWVLGRGGPGGELSNGCSYSARGIPGCGAYVGAAVGGNTDPRELEEQVGRQLGVRRTYWRSSDHSAAVSTAREDLGAGRLPWISFKLDASWAQAADGALDGWATSLSSELAQLPGPVWVAFHHEPEGDGEIDEWRAVQERLGPIVRSHAPNIGFTVILTGWNQLHGSDEYSLDRIWPDTRVDVAGFDIYQSYGLIRKGREVTTLSDLRQLYFDDISQWAEEQNVRWALGETGITDVASVDHPGLLGATFRDLVATGGIAMTYFDSSYNSTGSWTLERPFKREQFAEVLEGSPTLPRLTEPQPTGR